MATQTVRGKSSEEDPRKTNQLEACTYRGESSGRGESEEILVD